MREQGAGQSATNQGQCCNGLWLRNGVCSVACPAMGTACTVGGMVGRCNNGTVTACDAFGTITCTSLGPTQETCNMVDDNCDGTVDNITPTECSNPTRFESGPGLAICNVGRPSTGVARCIAGAPVCTAIEGFHFCQFAGIRTVEDPLHPGTMVTRHCGAGAGSNCVCGGSPGSCGPNSPSPTTCAPNSFCGSSAQNGGGPPGCVALPLCTGRGDLCWPASTTPEPTFTPLSVCI
ncbi:MAG: hypothetical protein U0269_23665 [Polyangiales bacterium]